MAANNDYNSLWTIKEGHNQPMKHHSFLKKGISIEIYWFLNSGPGFVWGRYSIGALPDQKEPAYP